MASSVSHCSQAQKLGENYYQARVAVLESLVNALPYTPSESIKNQSMLKLSKKIGLEAFKAWTQAGRIPGTNQEKEVANILKRLFNRFEILWNVTYEEKLGKDAVNQYYQLIQDISYQFPEECFFNEGICAINEKALFSYIDQVIKQAVQTFEQSPQTEPLASGTSVSDTLVQQEPFKRHSVVGDSFVNTLVSLVENSYLRGQTNGAKGFSVINVDMPASLLSQGLQAAQSSETVMQSTVATVATHSALVVPMWAKVELAKLLKEKDSEFILEPLFNELAIHMEQIKLQNFLNPNMSKLALIDFKKDLLKQVVMKVEAIIIKNWNQTYKLMMGEQGMQSYHEIAKHCFDGYQKDIIAVVLDQNGCVNSFKCVFLDDASDFMDHKIQQDVQAYIENQKKLQNEFQQKLLVEEMQKADRLWQIKIASERKAVVKACDLGRDQIAQECEQFLLSQKQFLQKIAFEKEMIEQKNYLSDQLLRDLDIEVAASIEKEKEQKALAFIVAANRESAKRFFEAEQQAEARKVIKKRCLARARCLQEIKELLSESTLERTNLQQQEDLGIDQLKMAKQKDWTFAARRTMDRELDLIRTMQREKDELQREKDELVRQLQELQTTPPNVSKSVPVAELVLKIQPRLKKHSNFVDAFTLPISELSKAKNSF
jgi:hypothetical protein